MKNRTSLMAAGIAGMGIFLSFLLKAGYGTDTCSFMNSSLSLRLGISLGTVMACSNILLFIPELAWGRKHIGPGTVLNMLCIGYISDFCMMLEDRFLPPELFLLHPYREAVFIGALLLFLISVSLYMNSGSGLSPFDAVPMMISSALHLPFYAVRIAWDFTAILIGVLAGGALTAGTVILAFTIGPAVSMIGRIMRKLI